VHLNKQKGLTLHAWHRTAKKKIANYLTKLAG
jgi:hypothetical protein